MAWIVNVIHAFVFLVLIIAYFVIKSKGIGFDKVEDYGIKKRNNIIFGFYGLIYGFSWLPTGIFYILAIILLFLLTIAFMVSLIGFLCIQCKVDKEEIKMISTNVESKSELGHLISISGRIRSGKTSLGNALCNEFERDIRASLLELIQRTKIQLYFLNFTVIDGIISLEMLKDVVHINYAMKRNITKKIMERLDIKKGLYHNFFTVLEIEEMIFDYVDATYILYYRKSNVIANFWRLSMVNLKPAILYTAETENIKLVYKTKKFYIENYSIVFKDENYLNATSADSNNYDAKTAGRKELKNLYGNMFKETCKMIVIKQDAKDDIANERRTYTNNIFIPSESRVLSNPYWAIIKRYEHKFSKYLKFERLKFRIKNFFLCEKKKISFDSYINSDVSKYKKYEALVFNIKEFIKSLAFVEYTVRDYYNADDVGLNIPSLYAERKFSFKLYDTIGNYKTHEFVYLAHHLYEMSDVCFNEVIASSFIKSKAELEKSVEFLYEKQKKEDEEKQKEHKKKASSKTSYNHYNEDEIVYFDHKKF